MTLGIAFLILFLPVIAVFIGNNFTTIAGYFNNALSVIMSVPMAADSLWGILPIGVGSFIVSVIVIALSASLIKRIVGGL